MRKNPAEGWELPPLDLSKLPLPAELRLESDQAPQPMSGNSFLPRGLWYFDPLCGEVYETNGFGYFESFSVSVPERPGLRLEICKKAEPKMDLISKWSDIAEMAKAGNINTSIDKLFELVCKDLGQEVTLTKESLIKLEQAVVSEIEVANSKKELPPPPAPAAKTKPLTPEEVEEIKAKQEEVFGKEKEPADFVTLRKSALKYMSEQDYDFLLSSVQYGELNPYSQEVMDKMARLIADSLCDENPENQHQIVEPDLVNASAESEPQPETVEEAKPEKGRRKKADKAEKTEPKDKEMVYPAIESVVVTNRNTGECKTFNEAMRSWFNLQVKKRTLEVEKQMYEDQWKARMTEIIDQEGGWHYCYSGDVIEAVHKQFMKQRRPDGTFKPATVKTQYATFRRDPEDRVVCVNEAQFQEWAQSVPEEERAFYGNIINVTVKGNKKAAKDAVASGEEIPGFILKEEIDPVGIPKITLDSPRASKSTAASAEESAEADNEDKEVA